MPKIFSFIISLVAILAGVWWFTSQEKADYHSDLKIVRLENTELKVELAESQGARGQGLGGRKNLPSDQGMLFIFEKPDKYSFWMRDMEFPLDIIWLDENKTVVDMVKDAKPESYPSTYFTPNKTALYVLEVNTGWAEKNNVKTGSKAFFAWPENYDKIKAPLRFRN
ncbi:MAG: DUF192 domain-containing protein [Patescibacteria group bacterium]